MLAAQRGGEGAGHGALSQIRKRDAWSTAGVCPIGAASGARAQERGGEESARVRKTPRPCAPTVSLPARPAPTAHAHAHAHAHAQAQGSSHVSPPTTALSF